jgi:ABC-type glycerol-3-phosphate transport system substrate-binding protein
MNRKRIFLLLALALIVPACMFANGDKEQASAGSQKPIELVYWSHYGQSPAFVQAFADASNVALKKLGYKNVTCRAEVIEYSGYEAKYLSAFASGNGPDMFLGRPSDWANEGGKHPVAMPFPADLEKTWTDALFSLLKPDGMFNGKRWGFPAENGAEQFLYINTDYMKEAGLDPVKDYPKTIDQLRTVAKKLTKYGADGTIVRSGYAPRYLGGGEGVAGKFIPFLHQYGARCLSEDLKTAEGYINSDAAKQAFQAYQDMVYKDKSVNLEFGAPEAAFESGQTAMIFREGWFGADVLAKAPNINFEVVPYVSGKVNVATGGGGAWCNMINAKSKYTDICLAIFKELAKPEYDVLLHKAAGYPPVLASTMNMDDPYFSSLPFAQACIDSSDKAPAPMYDSSSQWSSVAYMIGDSVAAVLNGANVNTEVDALANKMQTVLDQQ